MRGHGGSSRPPWSCAHALLALLGLALGACGATAGAPPPAAPADPDRLWLGPAFAGLPLTHVTAERLV